MVVPNAIIGGVDGGGNGWRMLMESLAVGRGISLPSQASGGKISDCCWLCFNSKTIWFKYWEI